MTKLGKLEAFLNSGSTVTARQITGMFGLANPTAAISQLRKIGVCVYANESTLRNGERVTKYRIGKPSRAMVATATAAGFFKPSRATVATTTAGFFA